MQLDPSSSRMLRRVSASRTLRRVSRAALALLVAAPMGACATKHDIRDLHDAIVALQVKQDSLMRLVEQQNAALVDTLAAQRNALMSVRGDLGNELTQMEQQHVQIMQLAGESQRGLAQLRQQIAQRSAQMQGGAGPGPALGDSTAAVTSAGGADSGSVAQLYSIGMQNLNRGATETARQAFEQIVQQYQNSPQAPAAQYMLAETYYKDKQYDKALRELERVVEMFPGSDRAPAALYRAGVIAEERGSKTKARQYFRRVIAGYPKSDEAKQAAQELRHLRR